MIIDVWANDLTQTTGLLAYIRNLILISKDEILLKLEKSEELMRKITVNFNYNNELKECFDYCRIGEKIKKILSKLAIIKNGLEQYYPDLALINLINRWILKFQGMFEDDNSIDTDTAIELEYDIIQWLEKIQELVSHEIKAYENTHGDHNKFKEELIIGKENIDENLEILDREYGLSIINYIIVILKENGLTLYQEKLGELKADPDLISGFLMTIQSFGSEISQKETPVLGLKYKNYNIEIETGDLIQAVLLINGKSNKFLTHSLSSFVREFEFKYQNALQNFLANISIFKKANEILQKSFEGPEKKKKKDVLKKWRCSGCNAPLEMEDVLKLKNQETIKCKYCGIVISELIV